MRKTLAILCIAFAAGGIVGATAIRAQAQTAPDCADKQAVIDTLLSFTVELVREVDAIKVYGPSVVPATGQGVRIPAGQQPQSPGVSTLSTGSGATISAMDTSSEKQDLRKKRGLGLTTADAYIGAADGPGIPTDHPKIYVEMNQYFSDDTASIEVKNGANVLTGTKIREECSAISGSTLKLCVQTYAYDLPESGGATITFSLNGKTEVFVLGPSNKSSHAQWF